ncbi:MAG: efflux RND transporter periplasmic adaptor subunit [Thiobacillus sp.]
MYRLFPLVLLGLVAACGKPDAPAAPAGGPPPAVVEVETVASADVPVSFEYVGRLEASREIEIRPRMAGTLLKRHFEEGAAVKAGAVLYSIDPVTPAAVVREKEADLANKRALAREAQEERGRRKRLAEQGFLSPSALASAVNAEAAAEAEVRIAQAQLVQAKVQLDHTTVRAPIAGVVGRAQQVEGALVAPEQSVLTTLAQIHPIHARFSLGEDERLALDAQRRDGSLKAGSGKVSLILADGSRSSVSGKVDFADYKANPETGAFDMRAEFANPGGELKPGQFVRVVVEGGVLTDAITVPQAAVLDGAQGKFVYVVAPAQAQPGQPAPPPGMTVALPRPVVVGAWVGGGEKGKNVKGRWVIQQGLQPGDNVIVEGTARIFFPGMPVTVAAPKPAPATPVTPPQ